MLSYCGWLRNPQAAPPKKPWKDDCPVNTNERYGFNRGFQVVQYFVHPQYFELSCYPKFGTKKEGIGLYKIYCFSLCVCFFSLDFPESVLSYCGWSRNPQAAPPKKPWKDDCPVNANKRYGFNRGFQVVQDLSIHSMAVAQNKRARANRRR